MSEIVTVLVNDRERQKFWQEVIESVERLPANSETRRDYKQEIALLDWAVGWFGKRTTIFHLGRGAEICADSRRIHR